MRVANQFIKIVNPQIITPFLSILLLKRQKIILLKFYLLSSIFFITNIQIYNVKYFNGVIHKILL